MPQGLTPEQEAAWRAGQREYLKEYRRANAEKLKERKRVRGPATAEHKARDAAQARAWRAANKEKVRAANVAQYEKHKHKRLAENAAWRAANKERKKSCAKAWHEANRTKNLEISKARYHAKKPEYQARAKEYRAANPEKFAAYNRNRKARLREAGGSHTGDDVKRLYERQRGLCLLCGVSLADGYHVDHVVPIAKGGHNNPDNLQLLCAPCNISKRDKLPETIIAERLL